MSTVEIHTREPYTVYIKTQAVDDLPEIITKVAPDADRVLVVSDRKVFSLYGNRLSELLKDKRCIPFIFTEGEQSKCFQTIEDGLEKLSEIPFSRNDLIVALGGGVTGDIAGFLASIYMRGIRYIQIPTTLLAMVDSSIGGKTGIDLKNGKNLCGTFYQPSAVIVDPDFLCALDKTALGDGIAEMIKYGMINDRQLFETVSANGFTITENILTRCISIKGNIVEEDENDHGKRAFLNFGHSVGHAIETLSGFSVTHGHAVAAGMAIVTRACVRSSICTDDVLQSLEQALLRYDLPIRCEYAAKELAAAMCTDKKMNATALSLIVPKTIGEVAIKPIEKNDLERFIRLGL